MSRYTDHIAEMVALGGAHECASDCPQPGADPEPRRVKRECTCPACANRHDPMASNLRAQGGPSLDYGALVIAAASVVNSWDDERPMEPLIEALRIILREGQGGPSLDVERLARALHEWLMSEPDVGRCFHDANERGYFAECEEGARFIAACLGVADSPRWTPEKHKRQHQLRMQEEDQL